MTGDDSTRDLLAILENFEKLLEGGTLREQVTALIPAHQHLRTIGASLVDADLEQSGRWRILQYFRAHVGIVLDTEEFLVVSGIGDYARRIRELRLEHGWPILSGGTAADLRDSDLDSVEELAIPAGLGARQYLLVEDHQDEAAAERWQQMNAIRRSSGSVKNKLLRYFRTNVNARISMDELKYIARDKKEWARRTRELRTEDGWPIVTKMSGDPSLPVGVYVLAEDRQGEVHDRDIPELTRREVMRRDEGRCRWTGCGWPDGYPAHDRRFLEVHHIQYHAAGGTNDPDNLVTLCNLHHDEVHRTRALDVVPLENESVKDSDSGLA